MSKRARASTAITVGLLALCACTGSPTTVDSGSDAGSIDDAADEGTVGTDGGIDAPDSRPPSRGFVDMLSTSGIDVPSGSWPLRVGPINAAAIADCDRDGLPDAFVFDWAGSGALWRNRGSMHFERIEPPPGLVGLAPSAAAFGDLDNDGLPDLIVALGVEALLRSRMDPSAPLDQELRVYRNRGNCQFEDASSAWGFGAWPSIRQSLIAGVDLADVNLDGRLDVLGRRILDGSAPLRLYLSQPDGTWHESASEVFGAMTGANWSNLFTDVDRDGLADLFIFFDGRFGRPARYLHRTPSAGVPTFVEEAFDPDYFGADALTSSLMGGASGDIDGDGALDLVVTDIGSQHLYPYRLARRDVAREAGVAFATLPSGAPRLGFTPSLADYDNDTWPDLAIVCGIDDGYFDPPTAVLAHNRGDGTFDDVSELLHQGSTYAGEWMTATDLDRDGRLDYWMGGFATPPRILHNEVDAGHSIAVRLHGRTSNHEGVGARVTVHLGQRTIVQEMQSGGGPWGYGEHRLVFGLGTAAAVDSIDVRWPDGYTQTVGAAASGTDVLVEEPELIRVDPPVSNVGSNVSIAVHPARPDGALLGAGHAVTVRMDPDGVMLPVRDDSAGGYSATASAVGPGVHTFTVAVDGVALLARPQVLAH